MGREIEDKEYSARDYEEFNRRIHDQADKLKQIIQQPGFGGQPTSIGAELEIYLIDPHGKVAPVNVELLQKLGDKQFQTELNKFNIEANFTPVMAAGKPFSALVEEMLAKYQELIHAAEALKTRPIAIGVLPSLTESNLTHEFMTPMGRYKLLARELSRHRGGPFHICIDGESPLDFKTSEICVEGANTSFQVHLTVPPSEFAAHFNAAQLTLPLALAVSANSGVFMNRCLWDETRVALFKQSIDSRVPDASGWRQPSRVSFGKGWIRSSAWELFSESVNLYQPIIPECYPEEEGQGLPELAELGLHMGLTWPWNRAIYSNQGNGHLRIEFRALPAGPTAIDMAANAAFSIGMAVGLAGRVDEYLARIPFEYAEYNFYRAAKYGLDATILWPQKYQNKPVEVPIRNVIDDMLHTANDGLKSIGVDREERDKFITVIYRRLSSAVTGARWCKQTFRHFMQKHGSQAACMAMQDLYYQHQVVGEPVSDWERLWR